MLKKLSNANECFFQPLLSSAFGFLNPVFRLYGIKYTMSSVNVTKKNENGRCQEPRQAVQSHPAASHNGLNVAVVP